MAWGRLPSREGLLAALALLALSLAGCLGALPSCDAVAPAPARGGDVYTYRARGTLALPLTQGWLVAASPAPDSAPATQGTIVLPPGSGLSVTIRERAEERLAYDGTLRPAYQVGYRVEPVGPGGALDASDEWVDAETANLVQANQRAMIRTADGAIHTIRTTRLARPPLLLAPLFWERDLREGMEGSIAFPGELYLPRNAGWGVLQHRVLGIHPEGGRCVADIEVRTRLPESSEPPLTTTLTIASDSPLPLRYRERIPREHGGDPGIPDELDLELVAATRGAGPPLPAFRGEAWEPRGLALADAVEGFPSGTEGLFPTSFPAAITAARADEEAGAWLRAHPEARLVWGQRHRGAPNGTLREQWWLAWALPGGAGLHVLVERRAPSGPGEASDLEARAHAGEGLAYPGPARGRLVSALELARVHRLVYGSDPEILWCRLDWRTCQVGTHAATGTPYADEARGAFPRPGIVVAIDRGWILQEDSYADVALGPPLR